MTVNAGPEYFSAEKKYLAATKTEDQLYWLEEMIRQAPKHKSSENFVANLKQRLKRMQEKQEKNKKTGKSSQKTVKKEGFQVALVGLTNAGKSALLARLTNAQPRVSSTLFTTKEPKLGTLLHRGFKAQLVDLPSIGSENFDRGIVNTADCILLVVDKLEDIPKINSEIPRALGTKIIVYNKIDLLDETQLRKLRATIQSKKLSAVPVSCFTEEGIEELKEKITSVMNVIRVYTKEPGKEPSKIPVVLAENSTIKDVAESILKGFSKRVKEIRLTGPSSKFSNQRVGLDHKLKDLDIVEFHTR